MQEQKSTNLTEPKQKVEEVRGDTPHLSDIKRKVEEVLGDAPQLLKVALENILRVHDPHADAEPGSAGRIGRQSVVDDAERRAAGTPVPGTGDARLDAEIAAEKARTETEAAAAETKKTEDPQPSGT